MSVHDGHRERLKRRFIEHGLDSFGELNALELLLFYAIPRRDTNELAHALIDRFGSLAGVMNASVQELTDVPGVGENTAALLALVPQLYKLAYVETVKKSTRVKSPQDAAKYLIPRFMLEKDEVLYLLCLDSQKRVVACAEVSRGVVDSVSCSTRRIVELALQHRASSVVLAHNHPDSHAEPSREDDEVTRRVFDALRLVGIPLIDHIIISGNSFISYADAGVIRMLSR